MPAIKKDKESLENYIVEFVEKHFEAYKTPIQMNVISSRFGKALREFYMFPMQSIEALAKQGRLYSITTEGSRTLVFPGFIKDYEIVDYVMPNGRISPGNRLLYMMKRHYDYYKRSSNKRKSQFRKTDEEQSEYEWALGILQQCVERGFPRLEEERRKMMEAQEPEET